MATKAKFKSDMSEALHTSASMLHKVGAMDKTTMLDFDARHLVAIEMAPAEIKPVTLLTDRPPCHINRMDKCQR